MDERRKFPRIKIDNQISFACLDNAGSLGRHLKGSVLNLSQGGTQIETTERIGIGDVILTAADEQHRIFKTKGKIAYCREIGDGKFFVGISFQGNNNENIQFIRCMVRAHHYRRASAKLN